MRILVLIFLFCTQISTAQDKLKIGYFGGLTGSKGQAAAKSLNAVKLVANSFNKTGGVLGRIVEVIPYDNAGVAVKNFSLFKKARQDGVFAIVGIHVSNDGLILSDLSEKHHLPLLVASATNPKIAKDKQYTVRFCFNDTKQGWVLADFLANTLKYKKTIVITDVSDSFTIGLSDEFRRFYSNMGGRITAELKIREEQTDLTDLINKIEELLQKEKQSVFLSTSALEAAYFVSAFNKRKLHPFILGSDGWQNQDLTRLITTLGTHIDMAAFSAHWHKLIPTGGNKKFVESYQREMGDITSFDADAAMTYDATKILLTAISKMGTLSPEKIIKFIKKHQWDTTTGVLIFDKNGEPKRPIFIMQIKQGVIQPWLTK